jgi:hypothetical protein
MWTRQKPPVGAARINWSHPTTRGLLHGVVLAEGAGMPYDAVRAVAGTLNGGAVWSVGSLGAHIACATAGYLQYAHTAAHLATTACTVFVRAALPAAGVRRGLFCKSGLDFGTGVLLEVGNNVHGPSLKVNAAVEAETSDSDMRGSGPHSIVGTYQAGGSSNIYVDGRLRATATATATSITSTGNDLYWGSLRPDRTAFDLTGGFIDVAWYFARALGGDEIVNLHLRPLAFLVQPRRRTYSIPGGGAAAALDGTSSLALSASASLTTAIPLAGSSSLALTTTSSLTTAIPLQASAVLALATSGDLTTQIPLAATSALALAASGTLTTAILVEGASALTLSATGALTTAIPLAASATLALSAEADLTAPGASMQAEAALALSASGTLTTAIPLGGTGALALAATGALTTAIPLAGAAALALTATGDLTAMTGIAGSATLALTATGALTTGIILAGSSALTLTATGGLLTGIPLAGLSTLQLLTAADLAPLTFLPVAKENQLAMLIARHEVRMWAAEHDLDLDDNLHRVELLS